MGYRSTFISVAEDCRASTGEVPPARAGVPTVAGVQFALLAGEPGRWTEEDVLVLSAPGVRGRSDVDEAELAALRAEYFATPRPCLRASPLPKSHGWGLHYDAEGRITLHAVDSADYARLRADATLTQLTAMRTRRAGR